jgi:hypothetical protein
MIDSEFRSLIPQLSDEEKIQLEENLLAEGCRDAISVWKKEQDKPKQCNHCKKETSFDWSMANTIEYFVCKACGYAYGLYILDGHNRYEICQKHELPFNIRIMEFKSRDEAMIWMIKTQFGRRNLSAWSRSQLALKLENLFRGKAKEKQLSGLKQFQDDSVSPTLAKRTDQIDVREELAEIAGVSHGTLDKAKRIQEEGNAEQIARLNTGKSSINQVYSEVKAVSQLCEGVRETVKGTWLEKEDKKLLEIGKYTEEEQIGVASIMIANPKKTVRRAIHEHWAGVYGFKILQLNEHLEFTHYEENEAKGIMQDIIDGKYPPFHKYSITYVSDVQDRWLREMAEGDAEQEGIEDDMPEGFSGTDLMNMDINEARKMSMSAFIKEEARKSERPMLVLPDGTEVAFEGKLTKTNLGKSITKYLDLPEWEAILIRRSGNVVFMSRASVNIDRFQDEVDRAYEQMELFGIED